MTYFLNLFITGSLMIFIVGFFGLFFESKSKFFYIISFEVMFISINLNFFVFSLILNLMSGMIFIVIIMIVSAIELVIILSFFIVMFKEVNYFDFEASYNRLKH